MKREEARSLEKRSKEVLLAALLLLSGSSSLTVPKAKRVLLGAVETIWDDASEMADDQSEVTSDADYEPSDRKRELMRRAIGTMAVLVVVQGETLSSVLEARARRIAVTEAFGAYNERTIQNAVAGGAEFVRFDATLDKRTCGSCESLHGTVYPISEAPSLPLHSHCRCVLQPV